MEPAALGRFNRAVRTLETPDRQRLAAGHWHVPQPGLPLSTELVPWPIAQTMVNVVHRHHSAPVGHKFSMGVFAGDHLVGVAICGRPVARKLDNGSGVLEVTRIACVSYKNAVSKLLSGVRKEASRLGAKMVITYTVPQEGGASLRASGFCCDGAAGGGNWSRKGRPRTDLHPTSPKVRWSYQLKRTKK